MNERIFRATRPGLLPLGPVAVASVDFTDFYEECQRHVVEVLGSTAEFVNPEFVQKRVVWSSARLFPFMPDDWLGEALINEYFTIPVASEVQVPGPTNQEWEVDLPDGLIDLRGINQGEDNSVSRVFYSYAKFQAAMSEMTGRTSVPHYIFIRQDDSLLMWYRPEEEMYVRMSWVKVLPDPTTVGDVLQCGERCVPILAAHVTANARVGEVTGEQAQALRNAWKEEVAEAFLLEKKKIADDPHLSAKLEALYRK